MGIQFLQERFEVPPLKAHEALYAKAIGIELEPLQLQYVEAFILAETAFIEKMNKKLADIEEAEEAIFDNGNYPDDFNPEQYGL